jgi:hypothetical protein
MSTTTPGADSAPPRNPSTGPRTASGKARSSMNALKTGIYAKSLVIAGEDPAALATLTEEYFQRYLPAVPEQRDQVDIMVRAVWTLRRLGVAEAQIFTHTMNNTYKLSADAPLGHAYFHCDRTLDRLQRFVNSTQRNLHNALHELERLRSLDPDPCPPPECPPPPPQPLATEPVTPTAQFVPSNPPPAPPEAPPVTPVPDPCPPPEFPPVPPQPPATEPVTPAAEFVPSNPLPAPPDAPLPYHRPGARCCFRPNDAWKSRLKQCPACFPHSKFNPD